MCSRSGYATWKSNTYSLFLAPLNPPRLPQLLVVSVVWFLCLLSLPLLCVGGLCLRKARTALQLSKMGNHVKARPRAKPKPKSIKAKVNRKMGSKRRLSRMGKEIKKGQKGAAASYLTRAQVRGVVEETWEGCMTGVWPAVAGTYAC